MPEEPIPPSTATSGISSPDASSSIASTMPTYPVQRHRWAPSLPFNGLAVEVGAFLIDQGFGSYKNPWRAEATLQGPFGGEPARQPIASQLHRTLRASTPLCRRPSPSKRGMLGWPLPSSRHCAAPTLALRRAPVFGRCDIQLFTQGGQEMRMVQAHLIRLSIHRHVCGST